MKVVDVSIDKLKPYAMNPRFNDNAVDQVAAVREREIIKRLSK